LSEQDVEVERVYTVPLSRAWITARHRRTRRAVNILREFAEHHMKSSEIKIDTELNETLWKRGITRPPRRITVKMEKDEDGVVTISLPKEDKKKPELESETPPAVVGESAPEVNQSAVPSTASASSAPPVEAPKETDQTKKSPKKATQKKKPKTTDGTE
jgi:large subunit ribosomal protein L31e